VPSEVRAVIESHTGPVTAAHTASAGLNSEIAVILETDGGRVFVKGRPAGRPAVTQRREAAINPYVRHLAPRLLWQANTCGWDLLGFEQVSGRHANYAPGSGHLAVVVTVLCELGTLRCPDQPEIKHAEQRWSAHLDDPDAAELFAGDTLLHTDFNPLNLLIHRDTARVIDWAWPTRGAAFIDPACWIVRLIAAGHTPHSAQAWARRCPAYATAPANAIALFALASSRMWQEIAQHDPAPWKRHMATAARTWLASSDLTSRLPAFSGRPFCASPTAAPTPAVLSTEHHHRDPGTRFAVVAGGGQDMNTIGGSATRNLVQENLHTGRVTPNAIAEGIALITEALPRGPAGHYRCRPRSPRCTTRHPAPRRPTGHRSWRCTSC